MSIYWSFRGGKWVYTDLSGGENEYILIFLGEKLVYTHFSGGENEYVTPVLKKNQRYSTCIQNVTIHIVTCLKYRDTYLDRNSVSLQLLYCTGCIYCIVHVISIVLYMLYLLYCTCFIYKQVQYNRYKMYNTIDTTCTIQ